VCSRLHEGIRSKSVFWRLILGHYATMTELREVWTLEDVMDARDLLDAREAIEGLARDQIKKARP
jgi:hypothetical protein